MSFVHLHLHTEYSLLDGACRIKNLPEYVKGLGQHAVAITDHGVMYGVIDFYKACKASGIKPIIGCEVYVAPRTRFDKVHELDSSARHLVLLCKNETGYRNLSYMVSCGFTEGFYIKPRIDMDLLKEHSEGLVALSACLSGEIPRRILANDYDGAKQIAIEMRELFGEDSFYLEIQDHGLAEEKIVQGGILKLHKETGIPLVVTNDAHYLRREDAEMQDILMCIQMGKTVDDPNRMRFESDQSYVKCEEEMAALFPEYPEAVENTVKIADMCNLEFEFNHYHLPAYPLPAGFSDSDHYFEFLCKKGFSELYGEGSIELKNRLEYEMNMIRKMGFVDYFLIVSDYIAYAKKHGIPVGPGRGSAAGSIVSYCLGITTVEPMKYSLYFERFLNPERVSMPDIDVDFCYQRRGEVIDYVNKKYGRDCVAQIVTFGTMAAKGAIRDVGRVLSMPYADVDIIAKMIPNTLHITIDDALNVSKQLKELYDSDNNVKKLLDTARAIEGMPRNTSTHAAGVVITSRPVYEFVPLSRNDESTVTQYTMTTIEELGLLKMDFLGLRNITVLNDALQMVKEREPSLTLENIPDNDPETMKMISDGHTCGVFQMESAGMTSVCTGLKPKDIEDITAIIALYRPGPMESIPRFIACKQNPKMIRYKHPLLEPILSVTYGCIVYQEQVIEIFRRLGGFSMGQADMVRRAISKKKVKEIEKEQNAFIYGDESRGICGCVANGIPDTVAKEIYQEIYDFANYAFNKAHAVCYAVVAYQTAWFKCHYPQEYMAALLTSVLDSSEKVAEYISECRECGIRLLPPDINRSRTSFTVDGNDIRFGLAAIKGLGINAVSRIISERELNGQYNSFTDFCNRIYGMDLNRRAVENLIRCGAFDSLKYRRSQLMEICPVVLDNVSYEAKKNLEGQFDLFGTSEATASYNEPTLRDIPEYSTSELLAMEKETTGLYLSGHPMDEYRQFAKEKGAVTIGSILSSFSEESGIHEFQDNQSVKIAGIITAVKTKTTKNNTLMAYVTVEDDTGDMELLVFERVLTANRENIAENKPVVVVGKISVRDDKAPQIIANSVSDITSVEALAEETSKQRVEQKRLFHKILPGEKVFLKFTGKTEIELEKVKAVISMFPGTNKVILYFEQTGKRYGTTCSIYSSMIDELKIILGDDCVVVK